MSVLFFDARIGSDFTMDAVWAGLVEFHGHTNVIDWPSSEKHREGIPRVIGDVEKDYGAERRSLCYTPHHDRLPRRTLGEINTMIATGQIDQIFIDEREETYALYLQTIARFHNIPVIVIAGHDRFWNTNVQQLQTYYGKNLKAVFLDNWIPSYDDIPFAHPMNYATNFDHLWNVDERYDLLKNKIYDICFMGYNSHGDRGQIVDHLVSKYGTDKNCLFVEKRPNTVECFLPKREYFKKMAQSRICINLKGAAQSGKALRFYEIPYVGSYMLSQRFDGLQVCPLVDGVHCDYFSSIQEMDEKIERALSHPNEREQKALNGHCQSLMFQSSLARVEYIYRMTKCISNW